MKRYGIGRIRLARKHRGSLSLGTIIPLLMTIGIPLALLLSILVPEFILPMGFAIALYLLTLLGWSAKTAIKEGVALLPVLPFVYLAIHFGLGWGSLVEIAPMVFKKSPK